MINVVKGFLGFAMDDNGWCYLDHKQRHPDVHRPSPVCTACVLDGTFVQSRAAVELLSPILYSQTPHHLQQQKHTKRHSANCCNVPGKH